MLGFDLRHIDRLKKAIITERLSKTQLTSFSKKKKNTTYKKALIITRHT